MKPLFGTENYVMILTSSGTGGLEAGVSNIVEPGDDVLVVNAGKFGERFYDLAKIYGANVETINVTYGESVNPLDIKKSLQENPNIKAVYATQNETSTGVENDIEAIGSILKGSNALFIVDAVSSLGAVPIEMDKWGIDILCTGSQKAFMVPPGLAMISVSDRSWETINECKTPRYYMDLREMKKGAPTQTPFTTGVSLVMGLLEALNMIEEEGKENVYRRHEIMQKMVRAAINGLGLKLFASDECGSRTITSVHIPEGVDIGQLRKVLRDKYHIDIAGGQGEMKSMLFRIAHMGYVDYLDIITNISGLELALFDIGYPVQLGAGTKAAQEVVCSESINT